RPRRAQPGRGGQASARNRRNAFMIENFEQLASGATELQGSVKKGDLTVRASEGAEWRLDWRSSEDQLPRVTREGSRLRIEQPSDGWELFGHRRMDIELTLPLGVRAADLRS